jgi:hypothetical protein
LKAHREAVRAAIPAGREALVAGDLDAFCEIMAHAVVTAEDHSKTRYVLVVREATGFNRPLIFGPYATADAATKVWESGLGVGGRGGIFEVIPAPLGPKARRASKRASETPS